MLPICNSGVVHILRNHGWGGSLEMITVLHRGGSGQMITILHRGGPPNGLSGPPKVIT